MRDFLWAQNLTNASNFNPKRKHKKTLENVALGNAKPTQNVLKFNVFPSGNIKLHKKNDFGESPNLALT